MKALTVQERREWQDKWDRFIKSEDRVSRLADEAEVTGDYRRYDELRADLNEIGTEIAHQFAQMLGFETAVEDA